MALGVPRLSELLAQVVKRGFKNQVYLQADIVQGFTLCATHCP